MSEPTQTHQPHANRAATGATEAEAKLRAKLSSVGQVLTLLSEIRATNAAEAEALAFMLGLLADYCGAEVGQ